MERNLIMDEQLREAALQYRRKSSNHGFLEERVHRERTE
jgi:hypothetical protein